MLPRIEYPSVYELMHDILIAVIQGRSDQDHMDWSKFLARSYYVTTSCQARANAL